MDHGGRTTDPNELLLGGRSPTKKDIKSHLGLARIFARKLQGYTTKLNDVDDIHQLCLIGIWKALQTYDEKKGKFSAYAWRSVLSVIENEYNKTKRLSRIPEDSICSIDIEDEDGKPLIIPKQNDNVVSELLIHDMWYTINKLKSKQAIVLIYYYKYSMTFPEIGKIMNISKQMVQRYHADALNILRRWAHDNNKRA